MKVVYINVVDNGSTGKIIYDIQKTLDKEKIDYCTYFGRGKKYHQYSKKIASEALFKIYSLISKITGNIYGFKYYSTFKLIYFLKKYNPDIVHLHVLNGYFINNYLLLSYLKKKNIQTIITLHSENFYTGNCGHSLDCEQWKTGCIKCPSFKKQINSLFIDTTKSNWKKMNLAFDNFSNVSIVAVSKWLQERAKLSKIFSQYEIDCIYNGIDTNIFKYNQFYRDFYRNKYQAGSKNIILFVTSNPKDPVKGVKYFFKLVEKFKNQNDFLFVCVGIDKIEINYDNILNLGIIKNSIDLSRIYCMADITLLTSQRETFSMVVAESLCCGTPIVGFRAGAPEQIAIKKYSRFVDFTDIDGLENNIYEMLEKKYNKEIISEESGNLYSSEKMSEHYLQIYKNIYKGKKNEK